MAAMTEFEKNALGMSSEQIIALVERNKGDEVMLVASILSDCQELLEMGHEQAKEQIRKSLNVAKYILFDYVLQPEEERR